MFLHEFFNFYKKMIKFYEQKYIKEFLNKNEYIFRKKTNPFIYYMVGPPGIGKTEIIEKITKENNWGLVKRELQNLPIEQLSGIPYELDIDLKSKIKFRYFHPKIEKIKGVIWGVNELYLEILRSCCDHSITVLFLDDFHTTDDIKLDYCLELFTHYKLNNYMLPPNLLILLAGNDSEETNSKLLTSNIRSRIITINVLPDYNIWKKEIKIHPIIISMLNKNKNLFLEKEKRNESFGCPRTYKRLSDFLYLYNNLYQNIDINFICEQAKGIVGDNAARYLKHELILFHKIKISFKDNLKNIINYINNIKNKNIDFLLFAEKMMEEFLSLDNGMFFKDNIRKIIKIFKILLQYNNQIFNDLLSTLIVKMRKTDKKKIEFATMFYEILAEEISLSFAQDVINNILENY